MKREELKIWFWNLYNSCYPILKDNMIYMVYDINFIRAKKLANILNKDVEYPTEINGEILFEYNTKLKYLYCNYKKIWYILEKKYSNDYFKIKILIRYWLDDYNNSKKVDIINNIYYMDFSSEYISIMSNIN